MSEEKKKKRLRSMFGRFSNWTLTNPLGVKICFALVLLSILLFIGFSISPRIFFDSDPRYEKLNDTTLSPTTFSLGAGRLEISQGGGARVKEIYKIDQIEFDFGLGKKGILSVRMFSDQKTWSVVKIGASYAVTTGIFKFNNGIVQSVAKGFREMDDEKPHHLFILNDGQNISVVLDKKPLASMKNQENLHGLDFLSGYDSIWIDNLKVQYSKTGSASEKFEDDFGRFENPYRRKVILIGCLVGLGIILLFTGSTWAFRHESFSVAMPRVVRHLGIPAVFMGLATLLQTFTPNLAIIFTLMSAILGLYGLAIYQWSGHPKMLFSENLNKKYVWVSWKGVIFLIGISICLLVLALILDWRLFPRTLEAAVKLAGTPIFSKAGLVTSNGEIFSGKILARSFLLEFTFKSNAPSAVQLSFDNSSNEDEKKSQTIGRKSISFLASLDPHLANQFLCSFHNSYTLPGNLYTAPQTPGGEIYYSIVATGGGFKAYAGNKVVADYRYPPFTDDFSIHFVPFDSKGEIRDLIIKPLKLSNWMTIFPPPIFINLFAHFFASLAIIVLACLAVAKLIKVQPSCVMSSARRCLVVLIIGFLFTVLWQFMADKTEDQPFSSPSLAAVFSFIISVFFILVLIVNRKRFSSRTQKAGVFLVVLLFTALLIEFIRIGFWSEISANLTQVSKRYSDLQYAWFLEPTLRNHNTFIDTYGFQGRTYSFDKDNKFRIAVLGGSQIRGEGLPENRPDLNLSNKLEKILQSNYGDKIQVINAGIDGSTMCIGANFYRGILKNYQPDILIVNYIMNDIAFKRPCPSCNDRSYDEAPMPLFFVSVIKRALDLFFLTSIASYFDFDTTKKKFVEQLECFIKNAQAEGAKILYVAEPVRYAMETGQFYTQGEGYVILDRPIELWKILEEHQAEGKLLTFDPMPGMYQHRDEELIMDRVHLTPRGHELYAQLLAGALEKTGWLNPSQ